MYEAIFLLVRLRTKPLKYFITLTGPPEGAWAGRNNVL